MTLISIRLIILLFSLLATPLWAATPVVDASSNSGVQSNQSSTQSYSHTAGTLVNGVAIIGVSSQDSTPGTISGVTYGGIAATNLITHSLGSSTTHAVSLWIFKNPPSGASAVVATFSEVMNSHIVSVATYNNVNQTVSTGTAVSADDFDTTAPSNAQVTVTSAVGELVVALADFASSTNTPTTSQNSRAAVLASGNHNHGQSDADGAATVNMVWTDAGSFLNTIVGVSLKPSVSSSSLMLLGVGQ